MSKHTPGPWHVYEGSNFCKVVPEGYDERVKKTHYLGGAICRMDDWTGKKHDPDAPWIVPNARLIAAAPDLLDACREALECLEGSGTPAERLLISAIAKVKQGEV